MKPAIVHRYTFPIREVVEMLLGDEAGDCEAWRVRVEGDEVIVDVVAPARAAVTGAPSVEPSEQDLDSLKEPRFVNAESELSDDAKPMESKASDPDSFSETEASEKVERKGGALAKRAGILCHERGFLTFLGVATADEAADRIRHECAIESRAELDHDERAASCFHDLNGRYKLWLEGYD